jgi:hypothetical protein
VNAIILSCWDGIHRARVAYVSRYCCPVVLTLYASIPVGEELDSRGTDNCVACFLSLLSLVSARGMNDPIPRSQHDWERYLQHSTVFLPHLRWARHDEVPLHAWRTSEVWHARASRVMSL